MSYAGRCYLVAPEHVRKLAPDEVCSTKPLIRQGLEELKRASKLAEHLDITQQEVTAEDLQQAAAQPAGNHFSAPIESVALPPKQEAASSSSAAPAAVLEPSEEELQGEHEIEDLQKLDAIKIDDENNDSDDESDPFLYTPSITLTDNAKNASYLLNASVSHAINSAYSFKL